MYELYYSFINFEDINKFIFSFINFEDLNKFIFKRNIKFLLHIKDVIQGDLGLDRTG